MDPGRALALARRYAKLARVRIPCDKAVLFGSHAKGEAAEHSAQAICCDLRRELEFL